MPDEKLSVKMISRKDAFHNPWPFSAAGIAKWLGDAHLEVGEADFESSTSAQGPGQLLKWESFTDNLDCFLNKSSVQKPTRKKILISYALWKDRPPSQGELPWASALIEHYEVYLWKGEGTSTDNLLTTAPLTDANAFWAQRHKIQPATATKIQDFFSAQHIPANEWIILDQAAYEQRWGQAPHILDLTGVGLLSEEDQYTVKQSVDPTQITEIWLHAPRAESLKFILKNFPKLDTLKLVSVSGPWLERYIIFFQESSVKKLILDDPILTPQLISLRDNKKPCLKINFKETYGIQELKIVNLKYRHVEIDLFLESQELFVVLGKTTRIEKFLSKNIIEKSEAHELTPLDQSDTLGEIFKIEPLKINLDSIDFDKLDIDEMKICKELIAVEITTKEEPKNINQYFPKIKYLKLICDYKKSLSLSLSLDNFKFLEFIEIEKFNLWALTNLPRLSGINLSKIASSEHDSGERNWHLPALKILNGAFYKIELEQCPELEYCARYSDDDVSHPKIKILYEVYNPENSEKIGKKNRIMNMPCLRKFDLFLYSGALEEKFSLATPKLQILTSASESQKINFNWMSCVELLIINDFSVDFSGESPEWLLVNPLIATPKIEKPPKPLIPEEITLKRPIIEEKKPSRVSAGFSFYSLKSDLRPQAPDPEDCTFSGKGEFKSLLRRYGETTAMMPSEYRVQIYDTVKWENGLLIFSESKPAEDQRCAGLVQKSKRKIPPGLIVDSGYFCGKLEVGKSYPLPLTAPVKEQGFFQMYVKSPLPRDVRVIWFKEYDSKDSSKQRYFIELLPKKEFSIFNFFYTHTAHVELFYDFEPDSRYSSQIFTPMSFKKSFLPDDLTLLMGIFIDQEDKLISLKDTKIPLAVRLQTLRQYCQFNSEEKLKKSFAAEGSMQQMLDIAQQRVGACIEMHQFFMLGALFIGVKVHLVLSETHARCEILCEDGSLVEINIGGGYAEDASDVDRNPRELLAQLTTEEPPAPGAKSEPPVSIPELEFPAVKVTRDDSKLMITTPPSSLTPVIPDFSRLIHAYLIERAVFDWKLFDKSPQPLLIELSSTLDVVTARRLYFSRADLPKNFLYIDSPQDFKRYWRTFILKDGKRRRCPGPLALMFETGGNLLINWSNFGKQREEYEALLKKGQLYGQQAKAQLNIVGLLCANQVSSTNLENICRLCRLPEPPVPRTTTATKSTTAQPIPAFLYADANWFERLIGTFSTEDGLYKMISGPLLQAIAEKCPVDIYQPPNNSGFKRFLEDLETEHRFFFNGEWIELPQEVTISLFPEIPLATCPPKSAVTPYICLSTQSTAALECKAEKIYIHRNNWHTLFAIDEYAENGLMRTQPGELARCAQCSRQPVFVMTETMPQPAWDELTAFISAQEFKQSFVFHLGTGAKMLAPIPLPDAKENTLIDRLSYLLNKSGHSHHFISADADFLAEQLYQLCSTQEHTEIIDLTPDMGIDQLLGSIQQLATTHDDKEEDGNLPMRYQRQKGALLTALEAGHTIILNGRLSERLRQELLPLFSSTPYLSWNGKRIPVKGRVLLVEPETAHPVQSALRPAFTVPVTDADYRAALLKTERVQTEPERKKSAELIDKLLLFFKLADYPHRGRTMPANLGKTWERLSQMQRLLESKETWHSHNPIKGLMLNKYVKPGNEYYAFLNVLAKFLFDENPADPVRIQKYQKFRKLCGKDSQEYAWRLLNSCNGATLKKILGDKWLDTVNFCWQSNQWDKILVKLEAEVADISTEVKEPTPGLEKMQRRLKSLINNPAAPKVLAIQGQPGVGKTHFLMQLAKEPSYDCYQGFEQIEQWLSNISPTKPALLLIDEANTYEPDALNFFAGLNRKPPKIFYKGQWYPLSPLHKVVVAVNPDHFPGRHRHKCLQNGMTVPAPMSGSQYLCQWLTDTYKVKLDLAQQVLAAAELFAELEPLQGYSFRNLQSVMMRYQALGSLYDALYGGFGLSVTTESKRKTFKAQLLKQLGLTESESASHACEFPIELTDAEAAIRQALKVREYVQKTSADLAYQRGVILQGAPGIGKFKLCESVLKQSGLKLASADYFIVTPKQENFRAIAEEVFNKGGILIVQKMHRDWA